MIKNYLITAFRNALNNRSIFLVNLTGLTFGLLCTLLLSIWAWVELSFDKFHSKSENIYQVLGEVKNNNGSIITHFAPSAIAEPLTEQLPEILKSARTFPARVVFTNNEKKFQEAGLYADPEFFSIFDFPLKEGDASQLFTSPNSVVITEKLAEKYFPNESALGKTIGILNGELNYYQVSGIAKSLPDNSSLQFDYILSYAEFENKFRPWWKSSNQASFNNFNVGLFVELAPNADIEQLNSKLSGFISEYTQEGSSNELFAYPFSEIYLQSDFSQGRVPTGKIKNVKLVILFAGIIFIIACINFINLSTAVAGQRVAEIGLRKTAGANVNQLVFQFLTESIIISILSMVIALTLLETLSPLFSTLLGSHISIPLKSWWFLLLVFSSSVFTGVLAGSYPSFILSSISPLKMLGNSKVKTPAFSKFRKGLVIVQFTLSISFIIFSFVAHDQINFLAEKELGVRKDNMLFHGLQGARAHRDAYKNELSSITGVESVAFTEQDPFQNSNGNSNVNWPGKPDDSNAFFNILQVGGDFVKTFELELVEGSGFNHLADKNAPRQYILNEAAAEVIASKDPINMNLELWGISGRVVGVVKNYHHQSLALGIEPVIIVYNPPDTWNAYISISGDDISESIESIRKVYAKYESQYPFDYHFVDERLKASYTDVSDMGKFSNSISTIAVLIASLGLFGLSAFVVEQRKLETGVRKILGAKDTSLVFLFSKDFAKIILVAFLIAAPIGYLYAVNWLNNFAYHTEVNLMPFAASIIITFGIALLTVSFHIIKAARNNPIDIIRNQ